MNDIIRFTVHGSTYDELRDAARSEALRFLFQDPPGEIPAYRFTDDFDWDLTIRAEAEERPQNGLGQYMGERRYEAEVILTISRHMPET